MLPAISPPYVPNFLSISLWHTHTQTCECTVHIFMKSIHTLRWKDKATNPMKRLKSVGQSTALLPTVTSQQLLDESTHCVYLFNQHTAQKVNLNFCFLLFSLAQRKIYINVTCCHGGTKERQEPGFYKVSTRNPNNIPPFWQLYFKSIKDCVKEKVYCIFMGMPDEKSLHFALCTSVNLYGLYVYIHVQRVWAARTRVGG